jgi:hypothetical protein
MKKNVELIGMLKWERNNEVIKESIEELMKVDGEEIVKLMKDVLHELLNIIIKNYQ